MSEATTYRTFVYHPIEKAKIIELADKAELPGWFIENEGWVHGPDELPKKLKNISEDDNALDPINTPPFPEEPEPIVDRDNEFGIKSDVYDNIIRLLKGERVKGKLGLSKTTLCRLYDLSEKYQKNKDEITPLLEKIVKAFGKRIYQTKLGAYFFQGVIPKRTNRKKVKL
jgi:hypothetical protein